MTAGVNRDGAEGTRQALLGTNPALAQPVERRDDPGRVAELERRVAELEAAKRGEPA
jgi:hypothetical protein